MQAVLCRVSIRLISRVLQDETPDHFHAPPNLQILESVKNRLPTLFCVKNRLPTLFCEFSARKLLLRGAGRAEPGRGSGTGCEGVCQPLNSKFAFRSSRGILARRKWPHPSCM